MWGAHEGMGWWMVFGGVIWLLFWASIIYLVFYAVTHHEPSSDGGGDALEIARRRLARGEITPEQFQEIALHLRPPAGQSP